METASGGARRALPGVGHASPTRMLPERMTHRGHGAWQERIVSRLCAAGQVSARNGRPHGGFCDGSRVAAHLLNA